MNATFVVHVKNVRGHFKNERVLTVTSILLMERDCLVNEGKLKLWLPTSWENRSYIFMKVIVCWHAKNVMKHLKTHMIGKGTWRYIMQEFQLNNDNCEESRRRVMEDDNNDNSLQSVQRRQTLHSPVRSSPEKLGQTSVSLPSWPVSPVNQPASPAAS